MQFRAIIGLLLLSVPALAQPGPVGGPAGRQFPRFGSAWYGAGGAPISYVGPGDSVSGAAAWYGMRAYNAAYATGSNPAITIRRASDNTTATIDILMTGKMAVATATAFCASTTCYVTEAFDQSGHGLNLTQPTAANQPGFSLSCAGSQPCMTFSGSQELQGTTPVVGQPITFAYVAERTGAFTSTDTVYIENAGVFTQARFEGSANTIGVLSQNGTVDAAAADNTYHSLIGIVNSSSSAMVVDNVSTAGTITSGGLAGNAAWLGGVNGAAFLTGTIAEFGIWPSAFTPTQQTAVCHNQSAAYSLGLSC